MRRRPRLGLQAKVLLTQVGSVLPVVGAVFDTWLPRPAAALEPPAPPTGQLVGTPA
jgi:hypothetical protein